MDTVSARLDIEMFVDCPECEHMIDLLSERDTDEYDHNEEGYLLRQMFPSNGSHDDFECKKVTCSQCKCTFNVKGLEW
ncbi:MAG: hypothetical protein GQ570_03650 [Helicobacteraceae bacterium]|nr:hypothetical protein [Helicobacteraceae bacterium]